MTYYTIIGSLEKKTQIENFLMKLSDSEIVQKMKIQFQYIFNNITFHEYIGFNPESINLFIVKGLEVQEMKPVTITEFIAQIEKAINALNAKEPKATINQIEQYIFYLLKRHTEYLINSLSLTQYPPDVLQKKTEEFFNEKLK